MITYEQCWNILKPSPSDVDAIVAATGVSRVVAAAMVNRGVSSADAPGYLSPLDTPLPDPFLLLNMDKAANRFADAVERGESTAVWGDYDVDGTTSLSLLCWFGRMLGVKFRPYIPCRFSEGYGMNADGVRQLAAEGVQLLVSVDCGITSHVEADLCHELGLDLVITDHHTPGGNIPDAYAVVNPLLPGSEYPYKKLAGVGVAYNLAVATHKVLRDRGWFSGDRGEPIIDPLLALVALGTVADVVDLQGVNRSLVARGLQIIRNGEHCFEGIRALCQVAGVSETTLTAGQIGFRLAPRLNASGRMETAQAAFDLLMAAEPYEALPVAESLDRLNTERQEVEAKVVELACQMIAETPAMWERKTIVLAHPEFHPGVIGIAASRLVERFSRPTVLISTGEEKGKGSCRSIKAFNMYDGLSACGDLLMGFGGHPMAAGLSLDPDKVQVFADRFEEYAGFLTEEDLRPTQTVDVEADPCDLDLAVCRQLDAMEPFGMGNSRPVFCMSGCKVDEARVLKGKHLKLKVSRGGKQFDAIGFGMGPIQVQEYVDLAFTVERNEWLGRVSLQLQLKGVSSGG